MSSTLSLLADLGLPCSRIRQTYEKAFSWFALFPPLLYPPCSPPEVAGVFFQPGWGGMDVQEKLFFEDGFLRGALQVHG